VYSAYDPQLGFYYYGEEEPRSGMYREYIGCHPKLITVDTETISLKERVVIGVGIAVNPRISFYFPLFPEPCSMVPWELLRNPYVTKIFHNAPFDLVCMQEWNMDNTNILDTNIIAHLLNVKPSRLIDVVSAMAAEGGRLPEVHQISEYIGKETKRTTLDVPTEVMAKKCCQDAIATYQVYEHFSPRVDMEYLKVEMEVISILTEMSFRGIKLDQEARGELESSLEQEVEYYLTMAEGEGFSPSSPQQVGYVLAKRGAYSVFKRLPWTNSRRTQLSTNVEVLNKMDDPMAALVLDYRGRSKLLNTYIKPWKGEKRAYTRFHLDGITGRPSSTERNMQNIPKGAPRGIFIPENTMFTDVDFQQIELRVLAEISGDREMQTILNDPKGDIHQATADFLNIPRYPSKSVNFAMIYGATDETIMETAKIRSLDRARRLKEAWFDRYREAGDWIQLQQRHGLEDPYVTTLYGRKIMLPTLDEESEGAIQRKAVNYPIQASAAEIVKRGMIKCKDLLMLLQIHDEILIDGFVPKERFEVLEHISPLWTPVSVKYLQRWE